MSLANETTKYIEEQESLGKTLVLRPKEPLPVGRVERDAQKLLAAYHLGRECAEEQWDIIRSFLGKE